MKTIKTSKEVREEVNKKTNLITKTKREYKIRNVKHYIKNYEDYSIDYFVCETSVGDIYVEMYK